MLSSAVELDLDLWEVNAEEAGRAYGLSSEGHWQELEFDPELSPTGTSNRTQLRFDRAAEQLCEPIEATQRALASSPYSELRDLHVCLASEQKIVITGQTSSFFFKQMAQETIRGAAKHHRSENCVQVVDR